SPRYKRGHKAPSYLSVKLHEWGSWNRCRQRGVQPRGAVHSLPRLDYGHILQESDMRGNCDADSVPIANQVVRQVSQHNVSVVAQLRREVAEKHRHAEEGAGVAVSRARLPDEIVVRIL